MIHCYHGYQYTYLINILLPGLPLLVVVTILQLRFVPYKTSCTFKYNFQVTIEQDGVQIPQPKFIGTNFGSKWEVTFGTAITVKCVQGYVSSFVN